MNERGKKSVTRRDFVRRGTSGLLAAAGLPLISGGLAAAPSDSGGARRKKVALIATEVRRYSHAQHFLDRFVEGYGWHGEHHKPPMDLVSLYVDQFPDGDLSRDRERRHPVKIYPTIAEALTLGGSKLAVDGVVIIGEHGRYPNNAKGQKLYPRYKFFKEVVKVFEDSGRSVPVFNDKHLSASWDECVEMQADSERLGFAFLAGSSLPVTWRIPSLEFSWGVALKESVSVCYGGVDSYDIHGIETAQCMSERRTGGEVGVRSIHAVRGERAWDMLEERPETLELALAATARSHSVSAPEGYTYAPVTLERARAASKDPVMYFMEHLDGFKTTLLMLNGLVTDFNYAGRRSGGRIESCQMQLPMPPRNTTLADFFNPQFNNIEEMILTGKAPYPSKRTLLTSGMVIFAVESLYRGQVPLLTPELAVAYQPSYRSTYWRA